MSRIAARFDRLAQQRRAGFIPFIMAGDPDYDRSLAILRGLPAAGADIIELGVAFSDPTADGPAVEAAGRRARAAGQTLALTLQMAQTFRRDDQDTPLVLMGYANPFYAYGYERFAADAASAGIDGIIAVDLPPEEDAPLRAPAAAAGIDLIRLATPTTDASRLPTVIENAAGFLYYVSVAGVTGGAAGAPVAVSAATTRLREASGLPVAVGFGVKTPADAAEMARSADAVVVGSSLVSRIAAAEDGALVRRDGGSDIAVNSVLSLARDLAEAVRAARGETQ